MSDFGTFVIDRGLFEHSAFKTEPFTEREAWIWMIGTAARSEKLRRVGAARITVQRGQLAFSIRFMAKRWQWAPATVQRFLSRLVTECMIEVAPSNEATVVTVTNYDKYQFTESVTESPPIHHATAVSSSNGEEKSTPPQTPESQNETAAVRIKGDNPSSSESEGGDAGNARAREAMISQLAFDLATDVMQILGIDTAFIPPGWCGAPMWLQAGLNSGWRPEVIRVAAAKVRARRNYQPPYSFRYLGQPITREHELMAAPLLPMPPVMVSSQDSPHAKTSADQTAPDWRSSRDAFRRAHAKLKAHNASQSETGDGETACGEVIQFAAPTRRS